MKNILKTLALLTAGVGAVAVVRRVSKPKKTWQRSIFVDGKTGEVSQTHPSITLGGITLSKAGNGFEIEFSKK